MYRGEIHRALERLDLTPGGPVEGLLGAAVLAEGRLMSSCMDTALNSDAKIRSGATRLQEAIAPVIQRLSEISPSATAVELHQLSGRFDEIMNDHPEFATYLRPGRKALSDLSGAFDVAIQQNRRPPTVVGLIQPAVALAVSYSHYGALKLLFEKYDDLSTPLKTNSVVEISGPSTLASFSDCMRVIAILGAAAESSLRIINGGVFAVEPEITISSIESGSPIRVSFLGSGKAVRLMLAMLRDVLRVPYLHFTPHGRVMQTMETFSRARELGIDSPEVLDSLRSAMRSASEVYANSVRNADTQVSVDGQVIEEDRPPQLEQIKALGVQEDKPLPRLQGPIEGDNQGDEDH